MKSNRLVLGAALMAEAVRVRLAAAAAPGQRHYGAA